MKSPAFSGTAFSVTIACLATCCAVAVVYSSQAVFGDIAVKYGISASDARLSFSVCSIAYALAFFVIGPLSDTFSARTMAVAGMLTAACATALAAGSSSAPIFLAISALQGASTAAVPVAMFALLPRLARKEQVGTFFGLVIAASVVGITLGRAGMGLLTAAQGLSGAQWVCSLLLLVMSGLVCTLPSGAPAATHRVGRQTYTRALRMLVAPDLRRLFAIGFLLFFGYLGTVTFLTLRLHEPPFMLDSATIGRISLLGLGAVLGAPVSGRLIARHGSLAVGVAGLCIVAAAIVCLAVAQTAMTVGAGLFLIFLGVFVCQPAVFVRIAERAPADLRGTASSLYLLTCLGAGSIASFALGPVWSWAGWVGVTTVCIVIIAGSLFLLARDAIA